MAQNSILNYLDFAWFLEVAIFTASWVILCHGVPPGKGSLRRVAAEALILFAVLVLLKTLLLILEGTVPVFTVLWALGQGGAAYLYICLRSPYQRQTQRILWCALYTAILSLASIAGMCSYLTGEFLAKGAAEGIVRIVVYVIMPLIALYLRKFNFDDFPEIPAGGFRLIAIGMGGIWLLYVVECLTSREDYQVTVALLTAYVCMFAMVLAAIRVMHTMCAEQTSILGLQAEKQRFLSERAMTRMAESTLEDLRSIRHDLKNQYAYMQILLSEGRYDELQSYFQNLSENLPERLNFIDCGNRTMNTVLNMELSKLRSDRIAVEHRFIVPPALPFADEDICAIISNLMDNAIEECHRMLHGGAGEAKLRIEIKPHQSYLYICCSNTTDRTELPRVGGGLRTTKSDEQLHGYGTRIVSKLAKKYNGYADYTLVNGWFSAKVMLDMMEGAAKK